MFLSTLHFIELKQGSNNNCEDLKMTSYSLTTLLKSLVVMFCFFNLTVDYKHRPLSRQKQEHSFQINDMP